VGPPVPKHQPKQHYNMHHQHNQQQARLHRRRDDDDEGCCFGGGRREMELSISIRRVTQPISPDLRGRWDCRGAGLPSSRINLDMCVLCSTSSSALVLFASSIPALAKMLIN